MRGGSSVAEAPTRLNDRAGDVSLHMLMLRRASTSTETPNECHEPAPRDENTKEAIVTSTCACLWSTAPYVRQSDAWPLLGGVPLCARSACCQKVPRAWQGLYTTHRGGVLRGCRTDRRGSDIRVCQQQRRMCGHRPSDCNPSVRKGGRKERLHVAATMKCSSATKC